LFDPKISFFLYIKAIIEPNGFEMFFMDLLLKFFKPIAS